MAALTVLGGLVKKKMKGVVYNKLPIMNRVFFSIGTPLSVRYFLFTDTLSARYFLFKDTLSVYNIFLNSN